MTDPDLGIPGYREVTEIDRGGFATIYRAWQPTFEREVAIKVLSGKADDTSIRRFRRECAAIGALSGHPNIVTVYDTGTTEDGRPYIVMEFLHGGSLAHQLAERGTFGVDEVLDFGVRIAGAIESAHRAGILHRDLKPENILMSRLGEPKVADFGLAQLPGVQPAVSGGLTGTIAHAAPEVLAGDDPTVGSDMYSLASTMYCLLSGRPPFALPGDPSIVATLARITNDPPPDLRARDVPAELCLVLEQGLAKAPADRQHDVAQCGRQLQAVQATLGKPITRLPIESAEPSRPPAPSVRGAPTPNSRGKRGRRVGLLGAGALVLAVLLMVAVPLVRRGSSALPMLYQDNFDAGQNWYEHDNDESRLAYEDGRYRIVAKRPHLSILSDTWFRGPVYGEPLTMLTDVSVRVRAQPLSPGSVLGLFCRYAPGGNHYRAILANDGEALIVKSEAGELTTLASGKVPEIGTARFVSLRLDCTGARAAHIALFVDGERAVEAEDRGAPPSGSVGMMANATETPADVLFEDFELRGRRLPA